MTLDNDDSDDAGAGDKTEGASGDVDPGWIEQDATLYDTFATSELATEPHGGPSDPAQAQPRPSPNPPCHCKVRLTSKVSADHSKAHQ